MLRNSRIILPTLVAIVSVLVYLSATISPDRSAIAPVVSLAIPFIILANLLLAIVSFRKNKNATFIYVLSLAVALPYIRSSVSFGRLFGSNSEASFTMMSLNAKLFRSPHTYGQFSQEMIDWVVNDSSDIKCIQEFSYNPNFPDIDVLKKIREHGYNVYSFATPNGIHNPGMAIVSKFPIIHKGIIGATNKSINNIIYADLKVGKDTIRIYNAHFRSMELELGKYKSMDRLEDNLKELGDKITGGAANRSHEVERLLAHASTSPYPVLICCDFNETPYSYNYFQVKRYFEDAFEEKGFGFGFTFNNSKLPIRIDHQFFSKGIDIVNFKTNKEMDLSDHFPLQGTYAIN